MKITNGFVFRKNCTAAFVAEVRRAAYPSRQELHWRVSVAAKITWVRVAQSVLGPLAAESCRHRQSAYVNWISVRGFVKLGHYL
jgi:hypothetical protein